MASATRLANFTEEPPRYPEDLKPTIQRSESSPHEFLHSPYSTVSSPSVKCEPGEHYPFFALNASSFTPASRPPPISTIIPHPSHASHVIPSVETFAFPAPLPQGQLPPLFANRQEYSTSHWPYPPTYEACHSPQTDVFYQRERGNFAHYPPRLNHPRTSPQADRLHGPCAAYHMNDYSHLPVTDFYPSMDELRYNECRSSPYRIIYSQAVDPNTGAAPYIRPVQSTATAPERPFLCETCGSRFNRNHDLKRHTRIHLPIKPFPCGWCDKAFSRKDALKRHLLVKACSGSKEVSVEESLRRAEQMGKRTLQDTTSSETFNTPSAPSEKSLPREESRDVKHESNFTSSIPIEYSIHSCPSPQSYISEKNDRSPLTDVPFPNYLIRDSMSNVSDDNISTSGSATTCSS